MPMAYVLSASGSIRRREMYTTYVVHTRMYNEGGGRSNVAEKQRRAGTRTLPFTDQCGFVRARSPLEA